MSAIKLIKQGIESGNWDDICSAYEELTGDPIAAPFLKNPPNQLQEELAALAAKMGMSVAALPVSKSGKKARPPEPKPGPENVLISEGSQKISVKKKELSKAELAALEKQAVEKYSVEDLEKERAATGRGPVSAKGRKPIFIGGELENDHQKQISEEIASTTYSQTRPAYKEVLKKCTQCSGEFEYKKSYPAGQLTGSFECLCPACLASKQR